jgi:hypothetical protein
VTTYRTDSGSRFTDTSFKQKNIQDFLIISTPLGCWVSPIPQLMIIRFLNAIILQPDKELLWKLLKVQPVHPVYNDQTV